MSQALDYLSKSIPIDDPKVIDITYYQQGERRPLPMAVSNDFNLASGQYAPVVRTIYNGEKDFGELGPVMKPIMDHAALNQRAWQLDLTSEALHTIVKQHGRWVLGKGLILECEPQVEVLKIEGIEIDQEEFNMKVEALWNNYAFKSTLADYSGMVPLNKIAKRALKNAEMGDVLAVLRIGKQNNVTVQLIDAQFVSTPVGLPLISNNDKLVNNSIGYDYQWPATGNRVRYGVEIDDTGKHIAYHVRVGVGLKWERIKARDSMGAIRARLIYGSEYRLENVRGIPNVTPSMQSAKQLDDYTVAVLGSAVERQRIAYFIEHEKGTEEKDPRVRNLAAIVGTESNMDLPVDVNGDQLANTIAVSTNKQTFNMAAGAKVSSPESRQELHYKDFFQTLSNSIAATIGIPPEVASQLYGGSYSASRAATNGFQFSLNIDRDDFGDQFYQWVFNLQLDVWVLALKIQAPGYLDALMKGNETILAAYRFANWTGDPVPQIDQLKEVQAARLLLGLGSAHGPLSNFEKVTKDLGQGSFKANMTQYAREILEMDEEGIEKVENKGQVIEDFDDPKEDKKGKPAKKTMTGKRGAGKQSS